VRVLFLLTTVGSKVHAHHATGFLSGVLKEKGHETAYLELDRVDYAKLKETIETFQPGVMAVSAVAQQMPYVTKLINYAKQTFPYLKTVLGGTHPMLKRDCINDIDGLDALCIGDGELPILKYVDTIEAGNLPSEDIPNMRFRMAEGVILETPLSYAVTEEDLAVLPLQDRMLFPYFNEVPFGSPLPFIPRVLWGRGCPYECTYCSVPSLKRLLKEPLQSSGAKWVRYPPPERCIEEIEGLLDRWQFDTYVIDDDVLTTRKSWILDLANKYPDQLRDRVSFEANLRVESIDRESMQALKDMGCKLLKFGLENGNYIIRQKILNRPIPDEKILEVFEWAHEIGIPAHTFNMVGVEQETKESVWETIKLNRQIRPERIQVTIFFPYIGTPMGDDARARGKIAVEQDSYYNGASVEIEGLSAWQIEFYTRWFKFLVYIGYSPKLAWGALKLAIKAEIKAALPDRVYRKYRSIRFGDMGYKDLQVETMGSDGEHPILEAQDIEDMDQQQVKAS
jgi:anaerobic magnesium-protoporphyrin IX monomethyl ester cyclase